jgi:hypothetical protein
VITTVVGALSTLKRSMVSSDKSDSDISV